MKRTRINVGLGALLLALAAACSSDKESTPDYAVTVGPAGLGIRLTDGGSITIPEGALERSTAIGFRTVSADDLPALPRALSAASDIYEVTPHGLSLEKSVSLTIPHRAMGTRGLSAYRLADATATDWTRVASGITVESETVTLELDEFSYYVVAQDDRDAGLVDMGDDSSMPDSGEPQFAECMDSQTLTGGMIAGGFVLEAGTCWQVDTLLTLSEGTLEVREGVRVEFGTDAGLRISGGRLKISGSAASPVLFTSQDPLVRWRGVELNDSMGVDNAWQYVTLENAGSQGWTGADYSGAAVYLDGATTLAMDHVTITGSQSHGLIAHRDVDYSFSNGTLSANAYPAYLHPDQVAGLGQETVFSDNENSHVRVGFSNVDGVARAATWPALGVPYRIEHRTSVDSDLTITAGTTLEMAQSVSLFVTSTGSLTARGTMSAPIVFQGATANTRGYWQGIEVRSSGTSASDYGIVLDYCELRGGGSDNWTGAAESLATLYMESASTASVTHTRFENSGRYGLWAGADARLGVFTDNTFMGNARAMLLHPDRASELDATTTVSGNDENLIFVAFSNVDRVTTDGTWVNLGAPYHVRTRMYAAAALTVAAGTTVEFAQGTGLIVETTGSLTTTGTAAEPVSFLGANAIDTGYWDGIRIDSLDPANSLTNTEIRHTGYSTWTGDAESAAAIYLTGGAQASLDAVTLGPGSGYGVFLEAASSALTCNNVTFDALGSGFVFDDDNAQALSGCPVAGP